MNRKTDALAIPHARRSTDRPQAGSGARGGGSSEQALFRLDLSRSLRMHRRLALGFVVAGVILAALYVVKSWSVYTAQCLVYIQPTPSGVLDAAPMHWPYNYDPATYDSYIQQQMSSMMRPDVLAGAVKKLSPGMWRQADESDQSAADRLKGAVEVARVGTSYQVAITAHAKNADTAAALANAVAASYIENTSHEQKAGDAERMAMLKEERDRVKQELDDDRAEQATLNDQLGVAAIGPEAPEHYDTDIALIHEELVKARADHDEAAARLTSMNSRSGPASAALDAEAEQIIATDPGLSSLKQALLTRRATLVSQMANLTPSHPQYKQNQEELEKIDASLETSTGELRAKAATRIEEQMRTDLDRTAGVEARLNAELAQMTKTASSATPKLQRSSDLANDITRLQARFNTVDEQLQNQTLEDNAPGTAHVAEAAVPPAHASEGGVIRNAFILLLLFIVLGLVAAVVAHKIDQRVYVASDIEQLLGYGPMAQLPDFDEVSDEVAEAHLLRLASGIEHSCKNAQMTSCVFTGTGSGVGVTTITKRVVQMLGALGTEAVLMGATGPVPHDRRSLSAALAPHLGDVAVPGRELLLLTDAAPLTVSAEAEHLAMRADCTILVIESGATTRAQLRAAAAGLQRLDAAAVGFVLNRVSLANADESFRQSVSAVDRHLRVQGRTTVRTVADASDLALDRALASHSSGPSREDLHETAALAEPAVAHAALTASAAEPARAVAQEPLRPIDSVSHLSGSTVARPQPELATLPIPQQVVAVSEPVPERASFWAQENRETEAFALAAAGYSAAKPASAATRERIRVAGGTVPPAAPFLVSENREAKAIAQPAPVVADEPLRVPPGAFSLAYMAAQPLDETVALPIPERMPVITGTHEHQKLEPEPFIPYEQPFGRPYERPNEAETMAMPAATAAEPVLEVPKQQPAAQSVPVERPAQQPYATQPGDEIPWWLNTSPKQAETAMLQPRAARMGTWYSVAAHNEQKPAAPGATERDKTASETPTRLSGLRGLLFPLGNRDTGAKKDAERDANGKNGNGNGSMGAHEYAPAVDPDQTVMIETPMPQVDLQPEPPSVPVPDPQPVQTKAEETVARGALPRWVTAEPEFLPPHPEEIVEPAEKKQTARLKTVSHNEDDFNDIQILPAKRGQYRR